MNDSMYHENKQIFQYDIEQRSHTEMKNLDDFSIRINLYERNIALYHTDTGASKIQDKLMIETEQQTTQYIAQLHAELDISKKWNGQVV